MIEFEQVEREKQRDLESPFDCREVTVEVDRRRYTVDVPFILHVFGGGIC